VKQVLKKKKGLEGVFCNAGAKTTPFGNQMGSSGKGKGQTITSTKKQGNGPKRKKGKRKKNSVPRVGLREKGLQRIAPGTSSLKGRGKRPEGGPPDVKKKGVEGSTDTRSRKASLEGKGEKLGSGEKKGLGEKKSCEPKGTP